ncbi:MAG: glycine cleavage system aminomethyltransferase GcvT [Anaerolineales bacterium]|nr:glycine cleavage system aminomethyltransferase GcvT [Anaerolineales bacterium]
MTEQLKRTHLYQWHVDHGGRMVPFAGWEMPVQYPTGPIQEHHTTRRVAGLFDIDHMGQVEVRGLQAETFVNHIVTYDVRQMALYEAHYALFCYPDGGTIDDLFVYKLPDPAEKGKVYYFLVINASNREKDVAWIQAHATEFDVTVRDISDETYMLAFQGPKAPELLDRITSADVQQAPRFTAVQGTILENIPILMGRTGYTGEDGYELFFPADEALKVWNKILKEGESEGVLPIGLAARDSLRFEPCMPLYGHELSADINAVEARLTFAVSFEKEFIGRDALLKTKLEGPRRVLVGFEMVDKSVPRAEYPVMHEGEQIGVVSTGMFSPTTSKYLGMAFIPRELAAIGNEIDILIRNKPVKARIVKRPFYTPVYRR